MPKIDIASLPISSGSGYPPPFAERMGDRRRVRLGDAAGLSAFGVNLTRLGPGAQSALRHWHETEDEFVYILSGELILMESGGETALGPGDAAGFRAGVDDGHHLVNRSSSPATYLEIGARNADEAAHYPDDDLAVTKAAGFFRFTRKNGAPAET